MSRNEGKSSSCNTRENCVFFNVKQGQNETEVKYLVIFNTKKSSFEMIGGGHIFVSLQLVGSETRHASPEQIAK